MFKISLTIITKNKQLLLIIELLIYKGRSWENLTVSRKNTLPPLIFAQCLAHYVLIM